jgi:transcriptional repressor NrdR
VKCPFCAHTENKVIDSRLSKDGLVIRRRRECDDCGKRFTTYERIEEIMPQVVKVDGRREPFDRLKVLRGVTFACEKRPIQASNLERLVDQIESDLQETGEKEVDSSVIADAVLVRLSELDDIAYVRYAARYGRFADLAGFARELDALLAHRGEARGDAAAGGPAGGTGDGPGEGP